MKILYTSNFARAGRHPKAIAITAAVPIWAKGMPHCKDLAPTYQLVSTYKLGRIDITEYSKRYLMMLQIRGKTPEQVLAGIPDGSVLLCYERPGEFCHRHLAAYWLMKGSDVQITELPLGG